MITALKALSEALQDSLNRCEHCGKEGEVFDCEECNYDKTKFTEQMTNLVNLLESDGDKRLAILMGILQPILK